MKKIITQNLPKIPIRVLSSSELHNEVVERHFSMHSFSGGGITVINGEVQSGKTKTAEEICSKIYSKSGEKITMTTTLADTHVYDQLSERMPGYVGVHKLYDLDKFSEVEISESFQKLFIVDEGDYGVEDTGRLSRVINKVLGSKLGMHIVIIGATNYSQMISDIINSQTNKVLDVKHFAFKPESNDITKRYYGPIQMLENNQIIDIEENDLQIDTKTGKLPVLVKETILEKHSKKRGISVIRVSSRDYKSKTSISLADKVVSDIKRDNKFKNFKIIQMYDADIRDFKKLFKQANTEAFFSDVILVAIGGLSASISFDDELKMFGHLRVAYETATVASSTAQGLPGRFSGYHSKDGVDITIFCNKKSLSFYSDVWVGIYNNGYVELPVSSTNKLSTHSYHRTKTSNIEKPMKVFWKGPISLIDKGILKKSYTTSRKERENFDYDMYSEIWNGGNELKNNTYDFKKLYHGMNHSSFQKSNYIWRDYLIMKEDLDDNTCIVFEIQNDSYYSRTDKLTTKSLYASLV